MSKPNLNFNTYGRGQALILLHGWGMNSAVFNHLLPLLKNYRVINVDLPGFGQSDEICSDDEIGNDNNAEIDAWCSILARSLPNNAIWLGWSLGGLVAMKMALLYPEKIKGLITVASSPCFQAQGSSNWLGIAPKVLKQFNQQLIEDLPKTLERFFAIQAMGSETAKQDIRELKQLLFQNKLPSEQALKQGLAMLEQVDLREDIVNITCPWLRIWGRLDGLVPNKILAKLPQSQSTLDITLPKASHAPFISHLPAFSNELLSWLNKI